MNEELYALAEILHRILTDREIIGFANSEENEEITREIKQYSTNIKRSLIQQEIEYSIFFKKCDSLHITNMIFSHDIVSIIAIYEFLERIVYFLESTDDALCDLISRFSINNLEQRPRFTEDIAGGQTASAFLRKHYGDVLERLHEGHLAAHDPVLLEALTREAHQEGQPRSVYVADLDAVLEARGALLAATLGLGMDDLRKPMVAERFAAFLGLSERQTQTDLPSAWAEHVLSERRGTDAAVTTPPGNTDPPTPHTTMPTLAPALWKDRKQEQWDVQDPTPVDFIRRYYLKFIGKGGLEHRGQLRLLDRGLYAALDKWLSSGHELPSDIDLPTKTERLDRDLLAAQADPDNKNLSWREAERLRGAARRRAHQSNDNDKNA